MRRACLLLLLALVASGCSIEWGDDAPGSTSASSVPVAAVTTPPVAVTPSPSPSGPPVRACESHVVGDISGWRRYSAIVGPVGFVGLPTYGTAGHRSFRSKGERYPALKALLVVERGPAVSVTILETERARLLYDPAGWRDRNLYPLEAGSRSMVFEPCDFVRRTQFNGAILVTGRMCVTIEVRVDGREPERARVPIGLPSCEPD